MTDTERIANEIYDHRVGETMKPSFVLGIDPGLSGALSLLNVQTKAVQAFDMPVRDARVDPEQLATVIDMLKTRNSIFAAVEMVSSMPRQAGAFNFGVSVGVVHGVLGALRVPFALVPPAHWKPAMGLRRMLNETQDQNKSRARALATKLWPENADLFKRVKDDGRAEACLIARFYAVKMAWMV